MTDSTGNAKLAVLIDADNANAARISELLAEVSRYGTVTVKRAYGDWTTSNLKSWKEVLHKLAIQPVQQFSYTVGKNATDSSLIIEAMDLLHTGQLTGFCIVSSDSDFTRLATRIRESGRQVYGFGEKKTPESFVAACDKFIFTEILITPSAAPPLGTAASSDALKKMISDVLVAATREDGWAALSLVGGMLEKNSPSFDPRHFGFQRLSQLVRKQPYLEVKEVPIGGNSTGVHVYVRMK